MNASSRTQPRQPSGTPAGGRFAGKANPESGVELSDEVAAMAIRVAESAHAKYERLWGLEVNTVAGDTILAFVSSVSNTGQVPRCPRAWCRSVAKTLALRQLAGSDRTEVRQALSAYRSECAELTQSLGRRLTHSEENAVAARIREAQRPTRKAPHNFHRQIKVESLDVTTDEPDLLVARYRNHRKIDPLYVEAESSDDDFEIGSIGDRVERLAAEGKTTEARRLAYSAIAERAGAPLPGRNTVTERRAAAIRKAVHNAGGVMAAIDQWKDGNQVGSAIFAPFGDDLSDSQKSSVVGVLEQHPNVANELWDGAVYTATVHRTPRIRA